MRRPTPRRRARPHARLSRSVTQETVNDDGSGTRDVSEDEESGAKPYGRHTPRISHLTVEERMDLVERDVREHSRVITSLTRRLSGGFTDEQMAQLRKVFADELGDIGLRADTADHQDTLREDFRFLRRMRHSWDGAAARVGNVILVAAVAVVLSILSLGFWSWISRGGH